jgi:hypothetical protein
LSILIKNNRLEEAGEYLLNAIEAMPKITELAANEKTKVHLEYFATIYYNMA